MKHLYTVVLSLVCFSLMAQPTGQGQRNGNKTSPLQIKGLIVDASSNNPLEFATFSIYRMIDSSLVSGGLTGANGIFEISVRSGKYYGIAEFMGYESVKVPISRPTQGSRSVDLGMISISPSGIELEGVEIQAERSQTIMTLDKRVFNVGKDLSNRGGTAQDILDNVPSITVDIEGGVSLRGNSGVRILINGRPSGLASADNANGLRSIPANMIESVEVITNPSARYEAEGMAGIINIILKKDDRGGFNGSFDVSTGWPKRAGIGANVNYRKGKLNWFANYGLNYRTNIGGGHSYSETTQNNGDIYIQDQDSDRDRSGLSNSIRGGLDYYFSDKELITGTFQYRHSNEDNFATTTYNDYLNDYPSYYISHTVRTDDEKEIEDNLEYSINYKKEFGSREHQFNLTMQYRDDLESEGSDYLENAETFLIDPIENIIQKSNNDEGEKTWLIQADYIKPIWKGGRLELGARTSLRSIANNYLVEEQLEDVWYIMEGLSNDFNYNEDIHAIYAIVGHEQDKISYQLGLRGEYSDVLTELLQTNEVNDRSYSNLFPSGHLNYKFSEGNSVQLSYSKRMRRPRFWDLNPFFTFSDSRNTFSGNPDLDPELTDSYEISYIRIWESLTLSSSLYYRHTDNTIQRILTFNTDGTTNRRPENLSTRENYGAELTFSFSGVKDLRLDGNVNLFQTSTNGSNVDASLQANDITWFSRMTARYSFWQNADLQLRFHYRAGVESTQGYRKAMNMIDLAFSKDVSANSTLTLSIRDLFNGRRRQGTTVGEGFYRESDFQWRGRTANLSFNYRINQKKKRQRSGNREGGFEGEGEF